LFGGACVHAVKVCQSETLWRIESSSGAYRIASGAERKKRDDPKGVFGKICGKYMVVSKNSGTPKRMVYMETPIKMDDLGVPPFKETST